MATNPMAKKARNSFLLGVALMLIIAAIGITVFILLLQKGTIHLGKDKIAYAFALKQDVKKGEEITSAMVEPVEVTEKAAPAGFYSSKIKSGKKLTDQEWIYKVKAKIDLTAGTILGSSLMEQENAIEDNLRIVEYNMLTLPTRLTAGEFVDIRLRLANGTDFIVVSQKKLKNIFGNTITLELTEEEMLLMNSAIVDAYLSNMANLYVIQYVNNDQEKATATYTPPKDVKELMKTDTNIVQTARDELDRRYTDKSRTTIESGLVDSDISNLEAGIKTQIENAKKAREAYLNGLTTY